ncbi:galectin-1-like isoform X2 [Dromiciops gliroides]|uniref:galectin-1-like isoform X2 n=1 Tax=Dromiciops gliroides TaxID=33562 RepID=UPI001CC6879B|nr:galectin-1-like isoform X2 [Dromiciops gliroides]
MSRSSGTHDKDEDWFSFPRFTIVMGKDEKNLAMYFSPQYSFLYGKHVIVCKNLHDGNWGMEKTEIYFPFTHGASVEIPIYFNGKFFMVTLPDGYPVGFSNCCETTMVDFLAVYGDIRITSLDFQ